MNKKNTIIWGVNFFAVFLYLSFLSFSSINVETKSFGKIYFNKPVSWENVYAYLYEENEENIEGLWPGEELKCEKDYIYYLNITNNMIENTNDIENYNIVFNNGDDEFSRYSVEADCLGYDKVYNLKKGIGENEETTVGEWLDYSEDIKIGKIPTTEMSIKNVIYMIGDGMGENHIIAGGIKNEEALNIQTIDDKCYVTTASLSTVTDSAASATALATGNKTQNGVIGKDKHGNDVETLMEYAKSRGLKTGIVCTQVLYHATPAGFSAHNEDRYNYEEIANNQIKTGIDVMLGGGREIFKELEQVINDNDYKCVNEISELENIKKEEKIIGTFAEGSISEEENRVSLSDMTQIALDRLENEKGFCLMIEGSNIDTYSHESNMERMLEELFDFDDAVGIAKKYVDEHPDTLLIITADHETGGLILEENTEELTNELFTSDGEHTNANVLLYAYGVGADDITKYDVIDNTSIYRFIKQGIK